VRAASLSAASWTIAMSRTIAVSRTIAMSWAIAVRVTTEHRDVDRPVAAWTGHRRLAPSQGVNGYECCAQRVLT
jgi:hypothetical protein